MKWLMKLGQPTWCAVLEVWVLGAFAVFLSVVWLVRHL
jgi:hypothetical protein